MTFQPPVDAVPCVVFEDEHLLVVNKPPGWNTHSPSPLAGEGIYDWLKHREPSWANLGIIHRLDKETSGVMVFGKTALANRSLTGQFTKRGVCKTYVLLTDCAVPHRELIVSTKLARVGDRYAGAAHGELAETRFRLRPPQANDEHLLPMGYKVVEARPLTGRTHQIRVQAAESGFPILGDALYGGSPFPRVCLHAAELRFDHPATAAPCLFACPADFETDPRQVLRRAVIEPEATDAFRVIHGASDGGPGWYVDRLGGFLLSQSEAALTVIQQQELARLAKVAGCEAAYHKILTRHFRQGAAAEAAPQPVLGPTAPARFTVRENGVKFELSFNEGYSVGLFLDQRDNRRRLLTGHVAADVSPLYVPNRQCAPKSTATGPTGRVQPEVLNCFAYTCGFSVCAALAGARTTSLDLSKKYLEWGKRNFSLNGLEIAAHDFIYGDAFDWLRRLVKKGRVFDVILLDPPTFSRSKRGDVFRAEKDYGRLVKAALPLVKPGSVLFASTNAAAWPAEEFLGTMEKATRATGRRIVQRHYVSQPPDFPISRTEPAYLKTVWLRIE